MTRPECADWFSSVMSNLYKGRYTLFQDSMCISILSHPILHSMYVLVSKIFYASSDVSDRTARSCILVSYIAVSYFNSGTVTKVKLSQNLLYN